MTAFVKFSMSPPEVLILEPAISEIIFTIFRSFCNFSEGLWWQFPHSCFFLVVFFFNLHFHLWLKNVPAQDLGFFWPFLGASQIRPSRGGPTGVVYLKIFLALFSILAPNKAQNKKTPVFFLRFGGSKMFQRCQHSFFAEISRLHFLLGWRNKLPKWFF